MLVLRSCRVEMRRNLSNEPNRESLPFQGNEVARLMCKNDIEDSPLQTERYRYVGTVSLFRIRVLVLYTSPTCGLPLE